MASLLSLSWLMMKKGKEVLVFGDIDQISDFALKKWREIAAKVLHQKKWFEVALSGGRTPVTFYRQLSACQKTIPWERIHIFLVDERFVPFTHPESNYGMIKDNLLSEVNIPPENLHPIFTKEATPQSSAEAYERNLKIFFGLDQDAFPRFDLIMLGIGEDGHTASLFPGSAWLREADRLVVGGSIKELERERVSITLPVINNAGSIIFLVKGRKKAQILKDILEGESPDLPAARVSSRRGKTFFLVDKEAAIHLEKNE